jgi:hypothetical protein
MKREKVMVDVMLLEDLSTVCQKMFEIICSKKLSDEDLSQLEYINKVLVTCNQIFRKNVKEMDNE